MVLHIINEEEYDQDHDTVVVTDESIELYPNKQLTCGTTIQIA